MTVAQPPIAKLRIGAEELDAGSGGVYDHLNPYDGSVQATIPLAGKAEMNRAIECAAAVADEWRRWQPSRRRAVLNRLADLIEENAAELARLTTLDGGIPLGNSKYLVDIALDWARYYAGWADKLSGEMLSSFDTTDQFAYTQPQPYGVVGVIITWNGPIVSLGMKVIPALAAGNCVVVKPAELTPFAPDLFGRLVREAGVPDCVFSILPGGIDAGEALVRHPKVEKISFTGGPIAARRILVDCAEQMKPAVLELGGKSASLVFPDVPDLERVCQEAVRRTVGTMAGQGCALPTRLLVHADIYRHVADRCVEIARDFRMGDPLDPAVQVGPVVNAAAAERIAAMLDRARADKAATFALGGGRAGGELAGRNFIEPTILTDVNPDHEIAKVEIFGPVLLIQKFRDDEEAVALANATDYGLAAYIHSSNIKRCHTLAERLRAGGVYINGGSQIRPHTPFGGLGISGYGKEGGRAGIDEFLRYKTVTIG